jgi:hypothetical protein
MRPRSTGFAILALIFASVSFAQTSPSAAGSGVPPVIRFSGTLAVAPGRVPVTFGLYQDEAGGTPLWAETQAVPVDTAGRYTVVLGTTAPLPVELFVTGEARWLDVAVEGVAPQPRRLLVSVPYALKAADAETIGGRPLSAFVLAGEKTGVGTDGLTYVDKRVLASGLAGGGSQAPGGPPSPLAGSGAAGGAGTPNFIGVFTDTTTLVNSVIYQAPGGSIGVNTTAPAAGFHAVSAVSPVAYFDVYSNALGALPVVYRAARGTPSAPTAVQANDILGGLAVRGYGSTAFSTGRGQVMYKAAENWTDSANGTYLQFTTTPLGSVGWAERMRIDPAGKVGIGTATPAQMLSVAGTIESTAGGFKFPDGTTQTTALSLAANTFTATQTITSGNLALPATTSGTSGVLTLGGMPWLHSFGVISNTFVGRASGGAFASTGAANTGFGFYSLFSNTTGTSNTAVGVSALHGNTTGYSNTGVGWMALFENVGGIGNAAFGAEALRHNAVDGNSAFGNQALTANTTGIENTAVGNAALSAPTSANGNTAVGFFSLNRATSGYNTAMGDNSLLATTGGVANTGVGWEAIWQNTTGDYNTGIGSAVLNDLYSGNYNTGLGTNAGNYLTTGSFNTFVGWNARPDATTPAVQYSTAIGANAIVTQDNSLVLGGTGTYAVNVGIGTSAPVDRLHVVGNVQVGTSGTLGCVKRADGGTIAGTCSSDLRLKTNVRSFSPMLERVARLRPVYFDWRAKEFPEYHFGTTTNSGLIAQEVEQVFPEMVATDERGYKAVNYSELPYLTLQAVKELKAENDAMKAENEALRRQLAGILERLSRLEKR